MDERDDASASGFIRSGFEGVSAVFTDVEILRELRVHWTRIQVYR